MQRILPTILSLVQHISTLTNEPHRYRPDQCDHCGRTVIWDHGHYGRKSARHGEASNPIRIPRFYCPGCGKTMSVLPECIPPRRWYLWKVQQAVFLFVLSGGSFRRAAQARDGPSRQTIRRWYARFFDNFSLHKDVLLNIFSDWGRTPKFIEFWLSCLQCIPLSEAMRYCFVGGVAIP